MARVMGRYGSRSTVSLRPWPAVWGRPVPPAVPAARHDPAGLAPPRRRHETDPQLRSGSQVTESFRIAKMSRPVELMLDLRQPAHRWSIRRPGGRPCPV